MNGREKGSVLPLFLGLLLITLLLATALLLFANYKRTGDDSSKTDLLSYSSQALNLALQAKSATKGDEGAFENLQRRQRRLVSTTDLTAVAETVPGLNVDGLRRHWTQLSEGLKDVLAGEEGVMSGFNSVARANQQVPGLLSDMGNLAALLAPGQLTAFEPALEKFENNARQIPRELASLVAGTSDRTRTVANLDTITGQLSQVVRALGGNETVAGIPVVAGDDARAGLSGIEVAVDQLTSEIRSSIDASEVAVDVQRAALQMDSAANSFFDATAGIRTGLAEQQLTFWQHWWVPLALLGASLLAALGFMLKARQPVQVAEADTQNAAIEQADKHQEAILRLLDEMGNLADGDLTVEATVTEDITGAIADSINYAIEALRELVSTIDLAAGSVDSAAQQTQAAANHLAKASDSQSRQVSSATESIATMATSIEQVSGNAERSSEVTRHSVEIAHKGGEAVRRTIDGMNTIRETIQDTSKRIKRLGESSQEIGNIVELINDIAEQTNILALNASIQASTSGEAGRGFAVVADEVQRLAERSTNATKQIEVLVKTIQSDTNEAVVSMERSTTDVVSGALLAENAGAALDEIEKVSNQIASLVKNISKTAREQAMAAADVTRNMGVLQEISAQTAENTGATSRSISKLAEMASQLRRSVAGFSLPKEVAVDEPEIDDEMLDNLASEENEFIDTLIVRERKPS